MRRWPVVVLVVVLVLGSAGGWAEGRRRAPGELTALERCAALAVGASSAAERRVAAMTAYVSPTLGARDRQLDRSLLDLVSREARRGRGSVETALAECRDVRIWWFNESHDEARDAYVGFLRAQRDRLAAIERDGLDPAGDYTEVRRLGDEAAAVLADAAGG